MKKNSFAAAIPFLNFTGEKALKKITEKRITEKSKFRISAYIPAYRNADIPVFILRQDGISDFPLIYNLWVAALKVSCKSHIALCPTLCR